MKKRALLAVLLLSLLIVGSWTLLSNPAVLEEAARSSWLAGHLIIVAAMILQALIAPIPAASISVVAGSLYGFSAVFCVGAGALIGALLSFTISRRYGKSYVERKFNPDGIKRINEFVDQHGFTAIFLSRLFPWVSFDLVSYAAGMTNISYRRFFLATLLGMIPGTVFYVELGGLLARHPLIHIGGFFAALAIIVLIYRKLASH